MRDPIVLLPGLQADGSSWMPLLSELVHSHAITIPMGHQYHDSISSMAQLAMGQSPERFHLIGWSMGGYIALELLRTAPERLLSLTLISTTAAPESAESLPRRAVALEQARRDGLQTYQESNMDRSLFAPDAVNPDRVRPMITAANILGLDALQQQTRAIVTRPDYRACLANSTVPLLLISGKEDRVIPVAHAREMQSLRPDAGYFELPECGHCPPLEHPEVVGRLLTDWFETLCGTSDPSGGRGEQSDSLSIGQ